MGLRKYLLITVLIFMAYFLQAETGNSARLSEGNEITSSPQKTRESELPPDNNENRRQLTASESAGDAATVKPAPEVTPDKGKASSEKEDSRLISIDFDNVDISLLIKFISELTGKNFLVDNNVKGKVTIISPSKITVDEAYKVFESVLEVSGFTTVPSGKVIKIIPSVEARSKDIETRFGNARISPEDKVVTQIIPLKYASPEELKKVFSAYISKGGLMISYDPTGILIVTDVLSNITRLLEIIELIDIPGTGEEITVIPLKHASARTMATSLGSVFKTFSGVAGAKRQPADTQMIIVPDERTNSLIIVASEVDTLKIKELLNLLDKEISGGGDIHVYYLQNSNAEELAKTLMALPKDTQQAAQQAGAANVLSKDIQIVSDKATNSLIITAQKDEYDILEEVIRKLDRPRSMVYIEALVLEVSMKNQYEIGVQWQVGEEGSSASVFSASNPGVNNFPSVDSNGNVSLSTGLTYGVLGNQITIGGIEFADLGAVFRAYATDSDVQIHSNPMIMTLDNEEAELKVTDEVPFITRRDERVNDSNYGGGYSNYDYKEVGVKLAITPQINQERFVRLKLDQEVSQVLSFNEEGQPTTFKRTAKTTVRIKDGQTIVIGGLIDKKDNRTNYRVPLLGRIPVLGYLFRSKTASLEKKNLYIFLTPHIIENPTEADKLYENKKGHIDTIKEGAIRMNTDGRLSEDMRRAELGYKYLQLKDYEKAMKYYHKSLDKNPNNPYAIYNMGYIYQLKGEREKAIEMYERLIAIDPPERAGESSEPLQLGRKLSDMAKDNLKSLKTEQ